MINLTVLLSVGGCLKKSVTQQGFWEENQTTENTQTSWQKTGVQNEKESVRTGSAQGQLTQATRPLLHR